MKCATLLMCVIYFYEARIMLYHVNCCITSKGGGFLEEERRLTRASGSASGEERDIRQW